MKEQLRPASPLFAVVVFGAGVAWLWCRPASKGPRRYLLAALIVYWFVACRAGSGVLVSGLDEGMPRVRSSEDARGAQVIVVLSGGALTPVVSGRFGRIPAYGTVLRALEGARVFNAIGATLVIASGGSPESERLVKPEGEVVRDAMVSAGVPAAAIVEENSSTTTREQAVYVAPMLRARGATRFVLVTSATHMRRALAVFRAEGLDPVPSTAPLYSDNAVLPPLLMPNVGSLSISDQAIYDYGAYVYYWWSGWTRPAIHVRDLR